MQSLPEVVVHAAHGGSTEDPPKSLIHKLKLLLLIQDVARLSNNALYVRLRILIKSWQDRIPPGRQHAVLSLLNEACNQPASAATC